MGMFDTFYANWRGKRLEIQHKDFECSLRSWRLGDKIDGSQFGIGGFISGFQSEINHLPKYDENTHDSWGDTRFFVGILHNGYWIDYAVTPTFKSAEAVLSELTIAYANPARVSIAWQSINSLHRNDNESLSSNLLLLQDFHSAFQSKNTKVNKNSIGFALRGRNTIPKKDLTVKNLVLKISDLFTSWREPKNKPSDYTYWKESFTLQDSFYFYDGPDYPAKTTVTNTESVLLSHLHNLNLLFFQALQSEDPTWSSKISANFSSALATELAILQKTYWGSMAWLNLRTSMPNLPLFPSEKSVDYNFHTSTTAWLHFVEVLGVDEDWLIDAAANVPAILDISQKPFPAFTLPSHYDTAFATLFSEMDMRTVINVPDENGIYPIHHAIHGCSHYESSHIRSALKNVDLCLLHGANHLQPDPDGNTPLMWLAENCQRVNDSWLWDKNDYRQKHHGGYETLEKLINQHSFLHMNRQGKTLHALWSKNAANDLLVAEERKKILLSINDSPDSAAATKAKAL